MIQLWKNTAGVVTQASSPTISPMKGREGEGKMEFPATALPELCAPPQERKSGIHCTFIRNDYFVDKTGRDVPCHTSHMSTAGRDPQSTMKGKARVS